MHVSIVDEPLKRFPHKHEFRPGDGESQLITS